jgi:hypothetical protein
VAIPAYEALQEKGMSARMLDVLMRGISTRQYAEVLPEMASTENTAAVGDLLEQLVARGADTKSKRLFVIDGAKALRAAINRVFGHSIRCSAAATTRFATCVTACRRNRKIR